MNFNKMYPTFSSFGTRPLSESARSQEMSNPTTFTTQTQEMPTFGTRPPTPPAPLVVRELSVAPPQQPFETKKPVDSGDVTKLFEQVKKFLKVNDEDYVNEFIKMNSIGTTFDVNYYYSYPGHRVHYIVMDICDNVTAVDFKRFSEMHPGYMLVVDFAPKNKEDNMNGLCEILNMNTLYDFQYSATNELPGCIQCILDKVIIPRKLKQ